jgi:hypothetical protein
LITSGADRVIVDTLIDGDGQSGQRTRRSPLGSMSLSFNWRDDTPAQSLYRQLQQAVADNRLQATGWSDEGFGSVPSYRAPAGNPAPQQTKLL